MRSASKIAISVCLALVAFSARFFLLEAAAWAHNRAAHPAPVQSGQGKPAGPNSNADASSQKQGPYPDFTIFFTGNVLANYAAD